MAAIAPVVPLFEGFLDHEAEPVKRILAAAERCLFRDGYGGMSIRDVAEEAGVSKSLLHYHFRSKEHLLLEVQVAVYNRLAAQVTEAVDAIEPGAARALLAYDALVERLRAVEELPVLAEIQARAMTNPRLQAQAARLRDYLCDRIVEMLTAFLGPDLARFPLAPRVTADLLLGVVTGLGLQAGIDRTPERVEAAFAGLRALLAAALGQLGEESSWTSKRSH